MAIELFYTLGDSNYLKLVLLGEVLNAPVPPFSKTEGKLLINFILEMKNVVRYHDTKLYR